MQKSNSAIFLPKLINSTSSSLKKIKKIPMKISKFFMTNTDDYFFANRQIEQIDHIILSHKENALKPWEKRMNNNVYNKYGKTNHEILKELTKKHSNSSVDIKNINWSQQSYYNKSQVEKIFDGYQIAKQIKNKYEVKSKCPQPIFDKNVFASDTIKISIKNIKLNLLKKEREKISNNQYEYEKCLEQEKMNLDNDIRNFENFKFKVKQSIKKDENILINLVEQNKQLFELNKKLSQDYKILIEEIMKYIKQIINYKSYATFIHKLLGDSQENYLNLNEQINIRNWTENDLDNYITKLVNELSIFINNTNFDNETMEVLSDGTRLESLFKIMEENVLNIVEERENYDKELKEIKEEFEIQYKTKMREYEDNNIKYNIYLKDVKDINNDIQVLLKNQGNVEEYKYTNELLDDICIFILDNDIFCDIDFNTTGSILNVSNCSFNKTGLSVLSNKNVTKSSINKKTNFNNKITKTYGKILNNSINSLKFKENLVEKCIQEISLLEEKDKNIIKAITTQMKINNRIAKYNEEKKNRLLNENEKREKLIEKFKKVIIRERFKFKSPTPNYILKQRNKFTEKVVKQPSEISMLYY